MIFMTLDDDFWKLLKTREKRASSTSTIADVLDGSEYSQLARPGGFLCPTSNPANLSFTINTDGVALFKSSKTEIWPLFLVINELPPSARCVIFILEYCTDTALCKLVVFNWELRNSPACVFFP